MDDIAILHHDKDYLRKLLKKINKYLKNINLEIKGDYQIFPSRIRGIDFVGYRHFGGLCFIKKINIKKINKKNEKYNEETKKWR